MILPSIAFKVNYHLLATDRTPRDRQNIKCSVYLYSRFEYCIGLSSVTTTCTEKSPPFYSYFDLATCYSSEVLYKDEYHACDANRAAEYFKKGVAVGNLFSLCYGDLVRTELDFNKIFSSFNDVARCWHITRLSPRVLILDYLNLTAQQ